MRSNKLLTSSTFNRKENLNKKNISIQLHFYNELLEWVRSNYVKKKPVFYRSNFIFYPY